MCRVQSDNFLQFIGIFMGTSYRLFTILLWAWIYKQKNHQSQNLITEAKTLRWRTGRMSHYIRLQHLYGNYPGHVVSFIGFVGFRIQMKKKNNTPSEKFWNSIRKSQKKNKNHYLYFNKMWRIKLFLGVRTHIFYWNRVQYTTQCPPKKGQKDKQRSTTHTHKTKDRVRRIPLKS
jgi:hypothetical protein